MVTIRKSFSIYLLFKVMFIHNFLFTTARFVGFYKLGNYYITDEEGKSNEKIYFLSMNFRANWMAAKSFCTSYGMNLVSLESEHEAKYFIKACENNSNYFEDVASHIGFTSEISNGSEKWFLTSTGKEVNYNLNCISQTNRNEDQCLSLVKADDGFKYSRVSCYGADLHGFICQKMVVKVVNWSDIFGG